jgi:hypothetical protein
MAKIFVHQDERQRNESTSVLEVSNTRYTKTNAKRSSGEIVGSGHVESSTPKLAPSRRLVKLASSLSGIG